jgi:hypothetical protein
VIDDGCADKNDSLVDQLKCAKHRIVERIKVIERNKNTEESREVMTELISILYNFEVMRKGFGG